MRPGSRVERATSADLAVLPLPERLRLAARIDLVDDAGNVRACMFRNVDGALDPVPSGVWSDE